MTPKATPPDRQRDYRYVTPLYRNLLLGSCWLALTVLTLGDTMEVIPGFAPFVASPAFPFFHEAHDLAALLVALYVAHQLSPTMGLRGISWFLALHLPYIYLRFPGELPEIMRLVLSSGVAVFAIHIIRVRNRLEAQLRAQATLDPLTGLLNHRLFHMELECQLARVRRYSERGAVMYLDLDGFKAVNDRLGHRAGDQLLKQVAGLLRQHLRATDLLARLGGDEFAVILPFTDRLQAHVVAERVREALHGMTIGDGAEPLRVTASIGLAFYPEHGESPEVILASADRAMYRVKETGRNRLAFYGEDEPHPPGAG